MANIKFCNLCDRNVAARKKFNWTIFLLGIILSVGIISGLYLIWFVMKGSDQCPICGNTSLLSSNTKAQIMKQDNLLSQDLAEFQRQRNEGLITLEEFEQKRQQILGSFKK